MRHLKLALAISAIALPATGVSAQAIFSATSAVINTGGPGFGSIADTFNRAGLVTTYTPNVTNFNTYIGANPQHDFVFSGNEWFSNDGTNAATVTYDLGSSRSFDRFALWNEDASGVGTVTLLISSNNVTFTSFATFTPTNNPVNFNYGAQVFSFATQTGRYVRFAATNCPQSLATFDACGIGEIAFRAAEAGGVPEPATWAMLIGGFGLAGASLRRRRPTFATA